MTSAQQHVLFANTRDEISGAEKFIQERHIINCYKADPAYGEGVAKALQIDISTLDLK